MKFPSGRLDFLWLQDSMAAGERVTVVTPNRRLATYLRREYDAAQLGAGRLAWDAADILPLETFFERAYRSFGLHSANSDLPRLVTGVQCRCMWEELVRRSDEHAGLMSSPQAAAQALAAWQSAHAWRLFPALRSFALHEDAQVFMTWVERYRQQCREQNLIDAAVLPDVMMKLMSAKDAGLIMPAHLLTAGFDIVTPQQRDFFDACKASGLQWQAVTQDSRPQRAATKRVVFASDAEELRCCAAWARQRLEENPLARIAIVVPDLRAKRRQVARALTDSLSPGARAQVRAHRDETMGLFNVSLGQPLSDYAMVNDAVMLIEFSIGKSMPFLTVSAMLRSPYIAGADDEIASRATLDAALRETSTPEISLFALQRKLSLEGKAGSALDSSLSSVELLRARMDQLASLGHGPARAGGDGRLQPSPRDWGRHFADVLKAWGFPGDRHLDSAEYQLLAKFRDAIESFTTLQLIKPRMKPDEALAQLRRILADIVFQPESSAGAADRAPPIQVLGILESAGQRFDAMWVTGLDGGAWPLPARPVLFIPAVLQRSAGVTEASAAASLALDQRITDGWCSSTSELVFSHAWHESAGNANEQARDPSALIRGIPLAATAEVLNVLPPSDFAEVLQAVGVREPIPDHPLQPLPAPTAIRGGSSVIRDQAACPFRAFARHRLLAQSLKTPHAGLDAAERGTLLHRALSLVWGRIGSHAGLLSLEDPRLDDVVRGAVMQAIADARAAGIENLTGRFAELERARLAGLIGEWLAYEKERAPFEVVERERKRPVTISGLSMSLRLDRLDRLADGTHALIDYKTGKASFRSWLGGRPDEPQLPLYLITAEQAVSALAFARLKRGERGKVFGFEGVSVIENLLPDVTPVELKPGMVRKGYASWDVLVQGWESSIGSLTKGFAGGVAEADPKNGGLTCAQCDLHGICRIAEMSTCAERDVATAQEADGGNGGRGASDE